MRVRIVLILDTLDGEEAFTAYLEFAQRVRDIGERVATLYDVLDAEGRPLAGRVIFDLDD